jgi:transposase InsO family protein
VIAFIDNHRDHFAVEFICRTLRATIVGFLTFRGYRAAKARSRSARAIRDELLIDELKTVHEQNFSVDGVEKMHVAMTRRSWRVGREQTRQLLRAAGLRGVQRGKPVFTTIADPAVALPADPVKRRFTAAAPNRLWVADVTFVRTWAGFCDTAFVTDACTRAVVGWSVAATMRIEDLPLHAFNQAQPGGLNTPISSGSGVRRHPHQVSTRTVRANRYRIHFPNVPERSLDAGRTGTRSATNPRSKTRPANPVRFSSTIPPGPPPS